MSDNGVGTLIRSTDQTSRGDVESISGKGDASGSNDPNSHFDIHQNAKKYYDIERSSTSMEEVHKWQRKHIQGQDQGKEGFPLNVIVDPAM
jgi:carbon-monoxide dehydrogenase catalytic subunit